MTAEQRTLIEPRDLWAIEVTCKKCRTCVRYAINGFHFQGFKTRQHACPNCKESLLNTPETNRIAELAETLSLLVKDSPEALIRFELHDFSSEP